MEKRVYDNDEDLAHEIWRKVQDERGIKYGDVYPDFIIDLDRRLERENGMPITEYEKVVNGFYDLVNNWKNEED